MFTISKQKYFKLSTFKAKTGCFDKHAQFELKKGTKLTGKWGKKAGRAPAESSWMLGSQQELKDTKLGSQQHTAELEIQSLS